MESSLDKLPDEIFISIVRFLELKDAIRTSVVSKNFHNLFAYPTRLDFDSHSTNMLASNSFKDEQSLFLGSVNRVFESYKEPFMESFGIRFPLMINDSVQGIIDEWISFVMSKGVTSLKLDFSYDYHYYKYPRLYLSMLDKLPSFVMKISRPYKSQFRLLKSLILKRVDICIVSILSMCTVLELLHVEDVLNLSNHSHSHFTSKSLKFLIIKDNDQFRFRHVSLEFHLPNLVEASFGGFYSYGLFADFSPMKSFSSYLSKLSLDCSLYPSHNKLSNLPIFEKVKELTLRITINSNHFGSFRDLLTEFFKACPSLQTTILETIWPNYNIKSLTTETNTSDSELESSSDSELGWSSDLDESDEQSWEEEYSPENVQEWLEREDDEFEPTLIPNLRTLEWRGAFRSYFEDDVSVALYIVKNASKLEKMVFDPRSQRSSSSYRVGVDEKEQMARENALQLGAVIPKHIKFVIL